MADRRLDLESQLKEAQSRLSSDPALALSQAHALFASRVEARNDARVIRLLARAQRQLGNAADAEALDLLAIQVGAGDRKIQQATEATRQGRFPEAEAIARAHLKAFEGDPLGLTILAEALLGMRRTVEAESVIRPVVEEIPRFVRARLALSRSLASQCRMNEAIDLLDGTIGDQPEILESLAELLAASNRFERAIETHRRLVAIESDDARAWLQHALTLRFAGRAAEAQDAVRRSLQLEPNYGPAWWVLANMAPQAISAADIDIMQRSLSQERNPENARHLHLALATMLDRSGDYPQAWRHLSAGKSIAARGARYDPAMFAAYNGSVIEGFDGQFFEDRAGFGSETSAPIFVIGLPRSGSTLIERILGQHSEIEAAGELPIIPRMIDELNAETNNRLGYRDLLAGLGKERSKQLGELYVRRSEEFRSSGKPFFIDKLHLNWVNLPLIRFILPNARIIDVRRNPIDCCWSNFKTLFASGHPASDNLAHTGHFYREYVRFVDHAAAWSPGSMLTLHYEAVVSDLEAETRRMCDYLGVDFEPACLDFHRAETPVATLSAEQVRRPLNREGIGRWIPYRQWLGPLYQALGPLAAPELDAVGVEAGPSRI